MAIFEVYSSDTADQVEFVSDKKPILGLVFPAIWLLWNRLWFAFLIYFIIAFFFAAMAGSKWAMFFGLISFLPGVFVFLEGKNWIGTNHERKGLSLRGLIDAENQESAELKWFSRQVHGTAGNKSIQPDNNSAQLAEIKPVRSGPSRTLDDPEFGLFSQD